VHQPNRVRWPVSLVSDYIGDSAKPAATALE
jgi:hypothetical protein